LGVEPTMPGRVRIVRRQSHCAGEICSLGEKPWTLL